MPTLKQQIEKILEGFKSNLDANLAGGGGWQLAGYLFYFSHQPDIAGVQGNIAA